MKRTFIVTVIISMALITSCKKDYNCVCQYEILGVDQTDIHEIKDVKRETAKAKCGEFEDETQILFSEAICDIE